MTKIYLDFANVFSKSNDKNLLPHCDIDFVTKLKPKIASFFRPIYTCSKLKLKTLK